MNQKRLSQVASIGAGGQTQPVRFRVALRDLARCAAVTAVMLARRQIRLPRDRVGTRLEFADGTSSWVYRETLADRPIQDPCVLVVEFRLRGVRGRLPHWIFRRESILNTPLFVGFCGFISKLWLAHDQHQVYRGLYEWDGPDRADRYVRALWWVLALVSAPGSIHHKVLPGLLRDQVLADPSVLDRAAAAPRPVASAAGPSGARSDWWRPVEVR